MLIAAALAIPASAALVAHYTFDSDFTDSANSFDLTGNNGAAAGATTAILGGGAMGGAGGGALDGNDDYAITSSNIGISGSAARTISVWIKVPADTGASNNPVDNGPTFVGMGGTTNYTRYDLRLSNSTGSVSNAYAGYIRLEIQGGNTMSTSDLGLNNDAWHNVVLTHDGTGTLAGTTFYVDGKAVARTTPTTSVNTTNAPLYVGSSPHTADNYRNANGFIDDTGLWNDALDAAGAATLNGLGRIGDNNLSWLDEAQALWAGNVGDTATINGATWEKVTGLTGALGDWSQVGGANGQGSFVVLDAANGGGIQIVPEPTVALLGGLGLLGLLRRRRA